MREDYLSGALAMKECPSCGAEAADDVAWCPKCGHHYAFWPGQAAGDGKPVEQQAGAGRPPEWDARWEDSWTRPSGRVPIVFGMCLLIGGAFVGVLGAVQPGPSVDYLGHVEESYRWPAIWAGAGLFNFGFVLWCIGQVQKALWFLPGRETGR